MITLVTVKEFIAETLLTVQVTARTVCMLKPALYACYNLHCFHVIMHWLGIHLENVLNKFGLATNKTGMFYSKTKMLHDNGQVAS